MINKHGTHNMYTNHKCRCNECKVFWSIYITEYHKKRRSRNIEQYLKQRRLTTYSWNENNKEKVKEIQRRYRTSEQGKIKRLFYEQQRNVRKRGVENTLTEDEWWWLVSYVYEYRCAFCNQETKLTIDHIIPLSLEGPHTLENVQPLCQSCNSRKGNRIKL